MTPPNLTEVEQRWYDAGERDGRAVGFWEGYAEALKDAGIEDPSTDIQDVMEEGNRDAKEI
jgi:hypothetical protein